MNSFKLVQWFFSSLYKKRALTFFFPFHFYNEWAETYTTYRRKSKQQSMRRLPNQQIRMESSFVMIVIIIIKQFQKKKSMPNLLKTKRGPHWMFLWWSKAVLLYVFKMYRNHKKIKNYKKNNNKESQKSSKKTSKYLKLKNYERV